MTDCILQIVPLMNQTGAVIERLDLVDGQKPDGMPRYRAQSRGDTRKIYGIDVTPDVVFPIDAITDAEAFAMYASCRDAAMEAAFSQAAATIAKQLNRIVVPNKGR